MKAIVTTLVFLALTAGCAKPLPVLGEVPDFSLTRETGTPVSKKDLEGRIWIANFIYGGCGEACPMLSFKMGELQKTCGQFSPTPWLVSFTVDPDADTPERLSEYARRYGADPMRWMFLTGNAQVVQKTLTDGFKVSAVKDPTKSESQNIFHSNKVVLVDRRGRIRGYYEMDDEGMGALVKAVGRLGVEN